MDLRGSTQGIIPPVALRMRVSRLIPPLKAPGGPLLTADDLVNHPLSLMLARKLTTQMALDDVRQIDVGSAWESHSILTVLTGGGITNSPKWGYADGHMANC